MRGRTWWFGTVLGGLLVAAGIAETVRLVRSGDGGIAFWFGTLVGGGGLVLAGALLLPRNPTPGFVLTTIGAWSRPHLRWRCPQPIARSW